MILIYGSLRRNFLGLHDSIIKFLFVLGLDILLEARFQAWLKHSSEVYNPVSSRHCIKTHIRSRL